MRLQLNTFAGFTKQHLAFGGSVRYPCDLPIACHSVYFILFSQSEIILLRNSGDSLLLWASDKAALSSLILASAVSYLIWTSRNAALKLLCNSAIFGKSD